MPRIPAWADSRPSIVPRKEGETMSFRIMASALILGALIVSGSTVQAQSQENCETRECHFDFFNPPVLCVSRCIDVSCLVKKIRVDTNCETIVCIDCDEQFKRYERDCDGKLLKTIDYIPAKCAVRFFEDPKDLNECGGSPLSYKLLKNGCWCVSSHNGGYWIVLACVPDCVDLCDDCGCYELTCKVRICTHPTEKPRECCD
jgi:hypothetical protein